MSTTQHRLGVNGVLISFLSIVMSVIACGGDDSGEPAAITPVAVLPEPTIEARSFIYPAKGYAVEMPEGWTADANSVQAGEFTIDAFFAPDSDTLDGVQPNIIVSCEQGATSFDEFVNNRSKTLDALGANGLRSSAGPSIAGVQTTRLDYSLERDTTQVGKIDVLFLAGCAWNVSLSSPLARATDYEQVLLEFVASFRRI